MSDRPVVVTKGQLRRSGSSEELDTNAEKRLDRLELAFSALVRCMLEQGFDLPAEALEMLED